MALAAVHLRFVTKSNQWIVISYTILFILAVSGWSLYDRPYFDFRPYHVGVNLQEGWQQMMEGQDSPYAEFFIERQDDMEDITEQVLTTPGYTFLLVAPYLEQADDSQLDLINQAYEYAKDNSYPFYCLTASGNQGVNMWRETTGAEYPFCLTDGTTLKTVIRSNPGLLLLKDGTIVRKWSHNRLPDENVLTGRLEELSIGQLDEDNIPGKILVIALWYLLPLALLVLTDRLWAWRCKKVKK